MPLHSRLLRGAGTGFVLSLALLAVGLARAGLALLTGSHVSTAGLFPDVLWFAAGFTGGGALAGLAWPGYDSVWRRRLAFIVGMTVPMAAIMTIESGPPSRWGGFDWVVGAGLSIAFGLALSVGHERAGRT